MGSGERESIRVAGDSSGSSGIARDYLEAARRHIDRIDQTLQRVDRGAAEFQQTVDGLSDAVADLAARFDQSQADMQDPPPKRDFHPVLN